LPVPAGALSSTNGISRALSSIEVNRGRDTCWSIRDGTPHQSIGSCRCSREAVSFGVEDEGRRAMANNFLSAGTPSPAADRVQAGSGLGDGLETFSTLS
jgi:hypothetical protein